MNYVILNDQDFFKDKINIKGLKEVELDGSDRVDAVFANITTRILEQLDNVTDGRDRILPESWLLKDSGVRFILCKIDRSILYNENEELIEKMFGLFSQEHFFIELWSFNKQESYNQLESYLLAYNKDFGYKEIITDDDSTEKEMVFDSLLKKIEKNLL